MLKYSVTKRRGKTKIKVEEKRKAVMNKIAKELQAEVTRLAGRKHERGGDNARWGGQNGSVYLRDQKFPIKVSRVRDTTANQEVLFETYQRLQKPFADDSNMVLKLLHGLSTHRYQESSSLAAEAMGLSASNLSKRFKQNITRILNRFQNRSLSGYDIVCVFVDAKRYADDGLMVALGITIEGKKIFLGAEHIHSENAKAIGQWFDNLITRGLRFEEGILLIIDGSKGIKKAIKRCLGEYAFIQRCHWHKRENVASYLDEAQQTLCRWRMQDAYAKTTYKEAEAELEKIHLELLNVNESAANSLAEGLEETLTSHRLGLAPELAKSLNTTNCLESVMSQLGQYTDNVDRWHNSNQILRWTVAALMDIGPRLNKIRGAQYLKTLRFKMKQIIQQRQSVEQLVKENSLEASGISQAVTI